jgi:hypothetical protein
MVRGLIEEDYDPFTGLPGPHIAKKKWARHPKEDKRISRGDDFAGDAWRNLKTGEVRHVAIGKIPSYIFQD